MKQNLQSPPPKNADGKVNPNNNERARSRNKKKSRTQAKGRNRLSHSTNNARLSNQKHAGAKDQQPPPTKKVQALRPPLIGVALISH